LLNLKILFFDYSRFLGGAEQSLLSVAPLLRCGIEPVLVVDRNAQWLQEIRQAGIKYRILNIGSRLSGLTQSRAILGGANPGLWAEFIRARREFDDILREERPDAICANTFKAAVFTGMYLGGFGMPLFWHVRDIVGGAAGLLWWASGFLKRPRLIAVSRAAAAQPALAWSGSAPRVAYNGIDCGLWRHKSGETGIPEIRSSIGMEPGETMLAAFGQLAPWKGQEHALRALSVLKKRGVLCRLALVGEAVFSDRSYPRKLKEMAEKLGVGENVKFCGWVKNPAPYMAAADIIVHTPVKPEPFGRVLVEAMCLGKPVVAFSTGAIPEIIENGRSGILCKPQELASVLERLIYDPGRARSIGEAARQRAERNFSLAESAQNIERILTEI
jgi:hypothetical protein